MVECIRGDSDDRFYQDALIELLVAILFMLFFGVIFLVTSVAPFAIIAIVIIYLRNAGA